MAGALQLLARLQAAPVPPVPPCKNSGEPLEAAPFLEVPPVPPVPPPKHDFQNQCENTAQVVEHLERPQQDGQPQHVHHTAATASPEWIAARDALHRHAYGNCPHCYPPFGRYCAVGADLRARYDCTP